MKFSGEMPSIDYNSDKPAQKHQESFKQREKDVVEEKGMSRKDALKLLGKGALFGFAAAAGLNTYKEFKKDENEKEEEKISYEDKESDMFNEKFNSVRDDLDSMKHEVSLDKIDKKYAEKLKNSISDWNGRYNSLRLEIQKPGQESYVIIELEKFEREVSMEKLQLERGFHLGV